MKILSQSQVERQLLKSRSRRPLAAGFTLIELMIVIFNRHDLAWYRGSAISKIGAAGAGKPR